MHYILEKLLNKRGIKDTTSLDESEIKTYDGWQRILSEGDITVDKIKQFCQAQIALIEGKWKDLDNSLEKNQRLIIMHNVYKAILDCMEKPKAEKDQLEKYLQQLLET